MEEFKGICEELIVRDGDETTRWAFDPSWFLVYSGFAWIWLPAGIVDTETNTCIIDQPENVEMLNFLQDMKFKDRLIPRSEDIPEGIDMFANDRVAIMQSGVWEVTSNRDALGEDKHWDIAWLPNNPMNPEENLSINYGAGYAMGKDVPDRDAAWTLLRYLSRPEMQEIFIVEDNWALPGRKSVTEAWANHVLNSGSGEPEHVWVWPEALEKGRSVPVTPAEKEMEDQYPNLMGPILVTGEMRAEEALPGIQAEIQAILDKYAD
jgi:ABC-type glycerol-3-phosphate transport system substrate-binding protein